MEKSLVLWFTQNKIAQKIKYEGILLGARLALSRLPTVVHGANLLTNALNMLLDL